MMHSKIFVVASIAVLAILGQFPLEAAWEDYERRQLSDVVAANSEMVSSVEDIGLTADWHPTLARVVFLGQKRVIAPAHAKLVLFAMKMIGREEEAKLFKHEILIREGEEEYWLPIQEPMLPSFEREVSDSAEVDIYAVWIGTIRVDKDLQWVFLVNEFDAIASAKKE